MDAPAKGRRVEFLSLGWAASSPVVLPMNDRQSRVATLLAFPSLAASIFILTILALEFIPDDSNLLAWLKAQKVDAYQIGALAMTICCIAAWHFNWRPFMWVDRKRAMASMAIAALILGQVLLWRPLWTSTTCAVNDYLRGAQTVTDLGLGILGCGVTWWGGKRWLQIRRGLGLPGGVLRKGGQDMSPGTVRLAIGFSLMPLLPGVFFIVALACSDLLHISSEWTLVTAYSVCAVIAMGLWGWLWRTTVNWTPRRIRFTVLLAALMTLAPFSALLPGSSNRLVEILRDVCPLMVLSIWFAGTARVWRNRNDENSQVDPAQWALQPNRTDADAITGHVTVQCAQCNYDLRGLREARCPECGWTTTLDDLVQRGLATLLAHNE